MDQVGVVDAEEITKYFTGEINQSDCVNHELKVTLLNKHKIRDKPSAGFESIEQTGDKKLKHDLKLDEESSHLLKCIEYLSNYEKPMSSKSRCLKFPQCKFSSILTHIIENQHHQHHASEEHRGRHRIAQIYEKGRLPIIIVPEKTIPGNISIENIEKFLGKGEYDEAARLANPDISKIEVEKQIRGKNIIFEVNSRPELLSEKDWEFVVAVFVLGR
jgi:hypothetical protein